MWTCATFRFRYASLRASKRINTACALWTSIIAHLASTIALQRRLAFRFAATIRAGEFGSKYVLHFRAFCAYANSLLSAFIGATKASSTAIRIDQAARVLQLQHLPPQRCRFGLCSCLRSFSYCLHSGESRRARCNSKSGDDRSHISAVAYGRFLVFAGSDDAASSIRAAPRTRILSFRDRKFALSSKCARAAIVVSALLKRKKLNTQTNKTCVANF